VLLLRLHYKLTGMLGSIDHPAVVDVSSHPEIADLYLAADAMVTDYSSTMFDFAVTAKPLLFYTYDMDRYRDEMRGFYFDLSVDPPGPLSTTTDQLVADLRNLPGLVRDHRDPTCVFGRGSVPTTTAAPPSGSSSASSGTRPSSVSARVTSRSGASRGRSPTQRFRWSELVIWSG
jgi:hypothetical protein